MPKGVYLHKRTPLAVRFWAKVDKTLLDGCWLWKGARSHGYGVINKDGKVLLTDRLAWELTYGVVPEGLDVLHHCDNPICIRFDHLFVGTATDNNNDSVHKNRWNHRKIITPIQAEEIRKSSLSQRKLAEHYGVSRSGNREYFKGNKF